MSEQATIEQSTEPAERPVLRRAFEAQITPGDGRTIDVRVVPYGVPAMVSDGGPVYREEWAHGCFDDQMQAANRLLANVEHELGIGGIVARGVTYSSDHVGFNATVRMLSGQDADKTLELVNDGVFGGISLEAFPKKSVRTAEGVVRRVKAHLDKIAFCRRPAFEDAVVLAVRHEVIDEHTIDETLLPLDIDPAMLERCRALGVRLPERYKAHPAVADTPANQSGTSEDGTRLDGSPFESSEE